MRSKSGVIQQLLSVCEQAFVCLQIPVTAKDLEDLTFTIHRSMSMEARHFHTPEHVLHLANAADPIQSLAALFHDIVYYQVDLGFAPDIYGCISQYIRTVDGEIWLGEASWPDDRLYHMALDIFRFTPGQKISTLVGSNEFLSALVMAKRLESLVPEKILLETMIYIEATIPFRGKNGQNVDPFIALADCLREICRVYQIPMKDAQIDDTVGGAVLFANRDVDSFAEKDVSKFLDGTWKLLPETNVALRSGRIYSIKDYRRALLKMEKFLEQLNPENIFHTYKGVPAESVYQEMVKMAYQNIATAREYLSVKLLAISILEALAELSGGDAPLTLFTEDVQRNGDGLLRYENFLSLPDELNIQEHSSVLYYLLNTRRPGESNFDMHSSPLALFLYLRLAPDQIQQLLSVGETMFAGHLKPRLFLQEFEPALVAAVARACAATVMTRREKLEQLALAFEPDSD